MSYDSQISKGVSAIVPVHNAERYLPDLIECLAGQTYKNLEVIFVDDGSTDSSPSILREAVGRHPGFRVITTQNQGAGAARNVGLSNAQGQYAIFVDADDLVEPTYIEKLARPFQSDSSIEVTVCAIDNFLEPEHEFRPAAWAIDKKIIPLETPFNPRETPFLFDGVCGYATNKMVKMDLIRRHNLKWQEIRMHEDMAFVQSALAFARKAYYVDEPLYHYRKRNDGTAQSSDVYQDSRYESLFLALEEIKSNLEQAGLWTVYEEAFMNYALGQCRWKYNRVSDAVRDSVGEALGRMWFDRLGLAQCPSDLLTSSEDYRFMVSLLDEAGQSLMEDVAPVTSRSSAPWAAVKKLLMRVRGRFSRKAIQ